MNRLTEWNNSKKNGAYIKACYEPYTCADFATLKCLRRCSHSLEATERLAAYEDTGLKPEGVAQRLEENRRLRAERDAAVKDLRRLVTDNNQCASCAKDESGECAERTSSSTRLLCRSWQWRGAEAG